MAQSNYNIPNQSAPAVRTQLNAVFSSIATNNSGTTAPSTTFAYQWWYDTTTNILKMRNAANSGWIEIAAFDQGAGSFDILRGVNLDALTEDTAPGADDLLLLELASGGAKRKVKFSNIGGAPSTSEVLTATAGASAGAVGTYAFLATSNGATAVNFGDTIAGSSLIPIGVRGTNNDLDASLISQAASQSGTWRAMGHKPVRFTPDAGQREATLFLRIS
jgi:hypothetical protein